MINPHQSIATLPLLSPVIYIGRPLRSSSLPGLLLQAGVDRPRRARHKVGHSALSLAVAKGVTTISLGELSDLMPRYRRHQWWWY